MKKSVLALAALAAIGFSGTAFAEERTAGSWTATTGPAAMSDSEMDRVTAGATPDPTGQGLTTSASANANGVATRSLNAVGPGSPPTGKGLGTCTINGGAASGC